MLKKLTQIGCSWCVIIPKAILDLLNINPVRDKVEFDVRDKEIVIRKAEKK